MAHYRRRLQAGRRDTSAFPEADGFEPAPVPGVVTTPERVTGAPGTCVAGPTVLCLNGGRFQVEVDWEDFEGGSGEGMAVPRTDDSGLFWFFRESNLELAVKVLDGRPVNGHWWVFYGSLTSVPFALTVTDTQTGERLTYRNPSDNMASRGDTTAFEAVE